uniref:Palmitoyltransferase n=1 Tax=Haptolina brevifila TaxID=156173 RepID=A0A7S2GJH6_9EUKA|mmetsp:Transcript_39924/g.79933  ORF Transcript_39924/g.79933 Transcript_39924/m.79933 type:complete len:235 (+) Transcript_39924:107-811(+)|eukprot:CAMPEP_0174732426 /NCGR_PEP_ID=MMETSP1094-20130205/59389_1 /TAXON_ID=156173 /ORGANISM="Chrysochromulina brevifilum, Strain UTEX LB 985" /LENGTH=234 /DNA_ID=CAMNT_0015934941 /DNA_START=107 /DNA_END=811 /DNA_ORIENTATION=+
MGSHGRLAGVALQLEDEEQAGLHEPRRVEDLPPLPTPNLSVQRSESTTGCTVVLVIIGLCVGFPNAVTASQGWKWPGPNEPWDGQAIGLTILYSEAVIALICLLGLMFGDPGVLKRSPERCFPLPEQVANRLRTGQSLVGLDNVYEDGHVYCVRCCVWRTMPVGKARYRDVDVHHCSVCQRCVRHFDHHCGVFGRCIAGNGLGGNMGYFKVILLMAFAGIVTCFATVLAGSTRR